MGKNIADMLAEKLRTGIVHPGNRERNQPPFGVALPMFRKSGNMPKEQVDLQNATAQTLAEAIVNTLETDGDIELVDRTEYRKLQTQAAGMPTEPTKITVSCRACGRELMVLSVGPDLKATVDGRQTINMLTKLRAKCPHRETE